MNLKEKWANVGLLDVVVTFQNAKGLFTVLKAQGDVVLVEDAKGNYYESHVNNARSEWVKFKDRLPADWVPNYMLKIHKFKVGQIVKAEELDGFRKFDIIHSTTYIDHVHRCEVKDGCMILNYNDNQGISYPATGEYEVIKTFEDTFAVKPIS
ncbi:hypothetical protein [Phage f2b1]|nr:hypothetical protein [Phage f2b1]